MFTLVLSTSCLWVICLADNDAVIPIEYDLHLNVDFTLDAQEFELPRVQFDGFVRIEIKLNKPTNQIAFKSEHLIIKDISVEKYIKQKNKYAYGRLVSSERNKYILELDEFLQTDEHCFVKIYFKVAEGVKNQGFEIIFYKNNVNEKEAIVVMNPNHPERVFPCLDGPDVKTPFSLRLNHGPRYNLEVAGCCWNMVKSLNDSYCTKRVPISVNELTFMITRFMYKLSPQQNVLLRFGARKSTLKSDKLKFAISYGEKLVTFYLNELSKFKMNMPFFDISGTISNRISVVAVPGLATDSYKNPGLATLKESSLIITSKSSPEEKKRVAELLAKVLAYHYYDVAMFNKEERTREAYESLVASSATYALEKVPIDGVAIPKLIFPSTESDEEILKQDPETASAYKEHQLKTFFTRNAGLPLVTVEIVDDDSLINVLQTPYYAEDYVMCWKLKLSYISSRTPEINKKLALSCFKPFVPIYDSNLSTKDWIIFNSEVMDACKMMYTTVNWKRLSFALYKTGFSGIKPFNRAQLVADALDFAWDVKCLPVSLRRNNVFQLRTNFEMSNRSNTFSYKLALPLVAYLQWETDYMALWVGLNKLSDISSKLVQHPGADSAAAFQRFMVGILTPLFENKVYFNLSVAPPAEGVKLQVLVAEYACQFSVPGCEDQASDLLHTWRAERHSNEATHSFTKELQKVVLCTAAKKGRVKDFDIWESWYNDGGKANDSQTQEDILYALGCSEDEEFLKSYINALPKLWLKDKMVPPFKKLASSTIGFRLAKEFLFRFIREIDDRELMMNCTDGNDKAFSTTDLNKVQLLAPTFSKTGDYLSVAAIFCTEDEDFKKLDSICYYIKEHADCTEVLATARHNMMWAGSHSKTFAQEINLAVEAYIKAYKEEKDKSFVVAQMTANKYLPNVPVN